MTASEISVCLVQAMKEPKVLAELNLTPQKHQQSVKSSSKRSQDCASNMVDFAFKIHVQNAQNKLATDLRTHYQQDKITKALIANKNDTLIEVVITHSLQEPYHSKLHNK